VRADTSAYISRVGHVLFSGELRPDHRENCFSEIVVQETDRDCDRKTRRTVEDS
jgi:hypothetical protein